MNKFSIKILFLLSLTVFVTACKKDNEKLQAEKIVKEWTGKTIVFPKDIRCKILGKDTICAELFEKPYKVMVYIDSLGCTSCKLRMFEWKKIIHEADSIAPGQIGFLFFFHPKSEKDLDYIIKRDRFDHPVFIDNTDEINTLNHFPDNMAYQSFLLGRNSQVLLVGNPSMNPKIWELYKELITGRKNLQNKPVTTTSIDKDQVTIDDLSVEKATKVYFELTNTGATPLIIEDIKTSCGCTVPSWEKQPVKQGMKTVVEVEIKPEETGHFQKTVDVYCNVQEGVIHLTVMGMVNQ